jgi:cell division protein FtsQ
VWIILASGVVVLLVAAMSKKNTERIRGVEIKISGIQNNYFIDKNEVLKILEKVNGKKLDRASFRSLNLTAMEKQLLQNDWIRKAELFFDNNKVLQVKVTEREPIARIFTVSGASFYIDSSLDKLPLSDKYSARLPVFTGFPTEVRVLKKKDSVLLNNIKILSEYINTHLFWMAQIDQLDITPDGDFELIPKLGNQLIRFGNADNYEQKFNKLLAFYKKVETNVGWNKYSVLDIRYKNQVVGVVRDAAEIQSDSLKAVEIMKEIISEAEKNTNDSTKIQLPQPEESNEKVNESPVSDKPSAEIKTEEKITIEKKINTRSIIHKPKKPLLKKQKSEETRSTLHHSPSNEKPPSTLSNEKNEERRVPKAVMPSKSDY